MCMGCMSTADFVVTGGVLSAASLRVGARRLLRTPGRWAAAVTDEEAADFVASLQPTEAGADVASPAGEAHPVPEPA